MPAWVPPATRTFSPARTDASRNAAAAGVRLPSSTRSESRAAFSTNLRMLTGCGPLTCADAGRGSPDLQFLRWLGWPTLNVYDCLADSLRTGRPHADLLRAAVQSRDETIASSSPPNAPMARKNQPCAVLM